MIVFLQQINLGILKLNNLDVQCHPCTRRGILTIRKRKIEKLRKNLGPAQWSDCKVKHNYDLKLKCSVNLGNGINNSEVTIDEDDDSTTEVQDIIGDIVIPSDRCSIDDMGMEDNHIADGSRKAWEDVDIDNQGGRDSSTQGNRLMILLITEFIYHLAKKWMKKKIRYPLSKEIGVSHPKA